MHSDRRRTRPARPTEVDGVQVRVRCRGAHSTDRMGVIAPASSISDVARHRTQIRSQAMRLAVFVCNATMLAAGLPAVGLAGDTPLTAESLAAVQSLVDHCGRLNPDAKARLEDYAAQVVKDTPQPEVDRLRASAAYKSAYAHATELLDAQRPADVATVCKGLVGDSAGSLAAQCRPGSPERCRRRPDTRPVAGPPASAELPGAPTVSHSSPGSCWSDPSQSARGGTWLEMPHRLRIRLKLPARPVRRALADSCSLDSLTRDMFRGAHLAQVCIAGCAPHDQHGAKPCRTERCRADPSGKVSLVSTRERREAAAALPEFCHFFADLEAGIGAHLQH